LPLCSAVIHSTMHFRQSLTSPPWMFRSLAICSKVSNGGTSTEDLPLRGLAYVRVWGGAGMAAEGSLMRIDERRAAYLPVKTGRRGCEVRRRETPRRDISMEISLSRVTLGDGLLECDRRSQLNNRWANRTILNRRSILELV
jgi:hypothetical protein